jgi:hypothetical protein
MTSHTGYCSECRKSCPGITCSDKCRKRRNRRQRDARTAHHLVMFELGKIRDSLKRREDTNKHIQDLTRLKAEISDLLLLAGDADAMRLHEMRTELARKRMA